MRPRHVFVFYIVCLALLALLSVCLPSSISLGDVTWRTPDLRSVLDLKEKTTAEAIDLDSLVLLPDTTELAPAEDTLVVETLVAPTTVADLPYIPGEDTRRYLSSFYQALQHADHRAVRVVHYGDSQIEEDRMTQQLRDTLQTRFGGRGIGLIPLQQTIATHTLRQRTYINGVRQDKQSALHRYIVYGPASGRRDDHRYGPMGQAAELNDEINEVMLTVTPLVPRAGSRDIRLLADTGVVLEQQSADTLWVRGQGLVYGLSLESPTGVIVDNVPMRGCSGYVFTSIDREQLSQFYEQSNTRLIILQFGGNAIPNNSVGGIRAATENIRQQVRYLHRCAPESSILLVGPSDMLTYIEGEQQSYPMVPVMDRLFEQMAEQEHIAYYSLYRAMGGAGSMAHWSEIGWAGNDGIHFTQSGARKAGQTLAHWLMDYDNAGESPETAGESPETAGESPETKIVNDN